MAFPTLPSMARCHAVGVIALGLLVSSATVVSGQTCLTGTSSVDSNGVGNDYGKSQLQTADTATPCSTYMASLRITTAFELAFEETVVVGIEYSCADDPTTFTYSLGPLASTSDVTYMVIPAPSTGGWAALTGTYDDILGVINSVAGFGDETGAAFNSVARFNVGVLRRVLCRRIAC